MSSKIIVDTTDTVEQEPTQNVEVVSEGSRTITIDTLKDDMDEIIREPVAFQAKRSSPPPPVPVAVTRKIPSSPKKKPVPSQNQKSPNTKKMLDGQSAFQDALKETIPVSDTVVEDQAVLEEEEVEPEQSLDAESIPQLPAGFQHSEEEEEEQQQQEDEEEEEEDAPFKAEEEEEEEEDEDVVKLRLLDEINSMMADGFLPPQQPSFNMDIKTLTKIKEYQEAAASEAFGIQLIGWGWINLIGIVENVNEKFDPAAKIFGPGKGLKLRGAAEKVSKDIRRYRTSFKYLWKKMASKKLEEYSPLITMALVTLDIIKKVHVENVRKEMRETAAAELSRPGSYEDAIKMTHHTPAPVGVPTYSEKLNQQVAPETQVVEEEQPTMRPVDDIDIPVSDEEPPAAAAAEDAEDEIEVEVPRGKGKGRARRSKRQVKDQGDFE